LELAANVIKAAKNKVVLVLWGGGTIDVSTLLENKKVGGILYVGQPSVQTLGIGDLLFGKRSPSGRMAQTTYPQSFVENLSVFDMHMRPGPSDYPKPGTKESALNPGRTHRFYTGKPVFPFGFGLSYTTFAYKVIQAPEFVPLEDVQKFLEKHSKRYLVPQEDPGVHYYLNVTNTGHADADDVVLGFIQPPGAGENGVPLQSLFGFERIQLQAGETKTVYLGAQMADFTAVDAKGKRHPLIGKHKVFFGVPDTRTLGQGYATTYTSLARKKQTF